MNRLILLFLLVPGLAGCIASEPDSWTHSQTNSYLLDSGQVQIPVQFTTRVESGLMVDATLDGQLMAQASFDSESGHLQWIQTAEGTDYRTNDERILPFHFGMDHRNDTHAPFRLPLLQSGWLAAAHGPGTHALGRINFTVAFTTSSWHAEFEGPCPGSCPVVNGHLLTRMNWNATGTLGDLWPDRLTIIPQPGQFANASIVRVAHDGPHFTINPKATPLEWTPIGAQGPCPLHLCESSPLETRFSPSVVWSHLAASPIFQSWDLRHDAQYPVLLLLGSEGSSETVGVRTQSYWLHAITFHGAEGRMGTFSIKVPRDETTLAQVELISDQDSPMWDFYPIDPFQGQVDFADLVRTEHDRRDAASDRIYLVANSPHNFPTLERRIEVHFVQDSVWTVRSLTTGALIFDGAATWNATAGPDSELDGAAATPIHPPTWMD